jgi:hypothetical protein
MIEDANPCWILEVGAIEVGLDGAQNLNGETWAKSSYASIIF